MVAVLGEFVGTFLFLFFSFAGTQVSNTPMAAPGSPPNTSNLLYSSLCFGFSLTVNVWAFYRVTGGLFNPVVCRGPLMAFSTVKELTMYRQVTLALCLVGGLSPLRGLLLVPTQLLAGIASAGVVSALFPGPANFGTRLGGGANTAQGLFIEMFLTSQLIFIIIMLAVVKHKGTFLAPVGIGLTFFVCELVGTFKIYITKVSLRFVLSALELTRYSSYDRRLLHRRISQSSPFPRPRRRQPLFPALPLDLLGRTDLGIFRRQRLLLPFAHVPIPVR